MLGSMAAALETGASSMTPRKNRPSTKPGPQARVYAETPPDPPDPSDDDDFGDEYVIEPEEILEDGEIERWRRRISSAELEVRQLSMQIALCSGGVVTVEYPSNLTIDDANRVHALLATLVIVE